MIHAPQKTGEDGIDYTYRHPIEVMTPFYLEATLVHEVLGITMDEWLVKSEHARTAALEWYRLKLTKDSYYNLPKDKRFGFLS